MPQDVIVVAKGATDQGAENSQTARLVRLRVHAAERLLSGFHVRVEAR